MERRKFVKSSALLGLGLGVGAGLGISLEFAAIKKWYDAQPRSLRTCDLHKVSDKLEADFQQLTEWMKTNGWLGYLNQAFGVNFELNGNDLKKQLIRELDNSKLAALRQNEQSGYDDFSGERLIQPGFPAYSLLFHTLASPRVRPEGVKEYPSLLQIDLLENYIYALCDWEQLRSIYGIDCKEELVFAVFAYEYRPAFKTPHHAYADMVFSRTGIARIGNEPLHYDKINRCHTTRPAAEFSEKNVAVMPARYGLYIARKVAHNNISLVEAEFHKGDDSKDDRNDAAKTFLQPVRKVFNDDLLIDAATIHYTEMHKSEKLKKLALTRGIVFEPEVIPAARGSAELIEQTESVRNVGSSFLVISRPDALIRFARENGRPLYFHVPKRDTTRFDNRYFTAFCTQEVENVELLEESGELARVYNKYPAPRNQPLFVNITNVAKDDSFYQIPHTKDEGFENKVNDVHVAPLFEDSICDGRVDVSTRTFKTGKIGCINANCLPAFSVVTAPDFFPQVDPLDLLAFDVAPGLSKESSFYEGGVASLSTARIKPNPKMIDTRADNTGDTYLAVLSGSRKDKTGVSPHRLPVYKNPASERGYEISGFLPDVASSVFAPGWDVTYCSLDNIHEIYIGTEGLGSPFVEDMKFCAALNGMWPATSPDAARTFQGSNEHNYRNPTAIPLMDEELGIFAGDHYCLGWDGEQGPFLERKSAPHGKKGAQWMINFTDLGRSDAVYNALKGKLDMSKLRKLRSNELIHRMECLRLCIHTLPQRNFNNEEYKSKITGFTYLWLVSAEKVNWGKEDAAALGIPADLVGAGKDWITKKENAKISGEGYLYVFANSVPDDAEEKDWADDLKRRRLACEQIYVCQVTNDQNAGNKIAWTEVKDGIINWQ